eukprot:scaffold40854_cov190-Skeletonema_marinoi.AAC.3
MPPLHTMYCFDDCISASCTEGQRIMSPNAEDLWVDDKTADQFQAIKKDLELGQVASEIRTKHEGPCAEVIRTIESQWEQIIGYTPHHIQENINEMKLPGFPHSVTVRHRKSRETELEEQEKHERNLQRMYEDW